jgi:hypothetical protein
VLLHHITKLLKKLSEGACYIIDNKKSNDIY